MDWPERFKERREIEARVNAWEEKGALKGCLECPNLIGECPQCGASHASESVCHACGYEYKNIAMHE